MRLPVSAPLPRSAVGEAGPPPLSVAHRGASADAPENTLAALRRAVALGVDMVEVDVQRTRDGALVLVHDETLVRTTDVAAVFPDRAPWRVGEFTLAELRRLDAGSWWSPEYAGEPVPTLTEAAELLAVGNTGLLLELKHPELHPGVVTELVEEVAQLHARDRAARRRHALAVQSFHIAAMKELKTRLPQVRVGLLGRPARTNLPALGSWADQVNPHHLLVDKRYVEAVHAAGMGCLVWTVDRGYGMRRALRMGVDGIITNRPDLLGGIVGAVAPTGPRQREHVPRSLPTWIPS